MPWRTSVNHVVLVQIVDGSEDLLDGLRGILFCEFPLVANAIEELASGGELSDDVVLVLRSKL